MREAIGPRLIEVLTMAWVKPFTTKSDYARHQADIVAMAASDGYLTTRVAAGLHSRSWQVTPAGLTHLYALNGMAGDHD